MRNFCFLLFFLSFCSFASAQNIGINSTGAAPNNSAMLDVASNNKGFLMPRMDASQRLAITTPAHSLLVFDTDSNSIFMYNLPQARWERINPVYNFNNFIMGNSTGDILVWNGSTWQAQPSCNLFTYLYKDNDGDGFGDRCEPLLACGTTFPCYVTTSTDNADSDPSVYPGAPELCDNKDNDQDGQTDELPIAGIGNSCSTGQPGVCASGTTQCISGVITCVRNQNPTTETCNSLDDDCDGLIDEDFPLKGTVCIVGTGACQRTGVWVCNGLGTGLVCSATPGIPTTEICNGIDDDCNGVVDGITRSCYTGPGGTSGVGACRSGTQVCSAGTWGACVGQVLPSVETCDNIDNNCNGVVDDGLTRSCYTGPVGTAGVGRCRSGTQNCSAGLWGACVGQVLPIAEIIGNGIDDNCDGITQ